jgi:hypothetical protein
MAVSEALPVADAGSELIIDFGRSGNSATYRRTGWAEPEPRHTWTLGRESTLELPRPATSGDYRLILEIGPFIWQDRLPAQRLTVAVNGAEIGNFVIDRVGAVACAVPWRLIERSERIVLSLSHPDAARPADINRVPDHREIALAFEMVTFVRTTDEGADSGDAAMQSSTAEIDSMPIDRLMMQFESLGENCEFGLAQRRCGAEPLGMLRFASTPLSALLAALKVRFEGLGEADQLEVNVSPNNREYLVRDRRFGILYHPWLLVGEADPDELLQREVKRLPLLKRKLIEDLEEGSKIFVYRGMRPLPRVLLLRLVDALRELGPCTLLWVEVQDTQHPAGTVEVLGDGLLKGYIDRFAPGDNAHDLSLDCWIELCRRALAIHVANE